MSGATMLVFVLGAFFTLTGYRKTFTASGRRVFTLFDSLRVPRVLQGALVAGEGLGGLGLLASLTGWFIPAFRVVVALGLIAIMLGAYALDTVPGVMAKNPAPRELSRVVSNLICTPEFLLLAVLTSFVL